MEILISQNDINPNININEQENQLIYVDGGGNVIGVSDVLVNGNSVVINGIAYVKVPTKTNELLNNSGFLTSETDPTVPYYVKQITLSDISNWNSKQNALVSGANIKTVNSNSLLGSGNIEITGNVYTAGDGISIDSNNIITNEITSYNDLIDLPTIPTKTSDLINDNNFVSQDDLSEVAFTGSYDSLSNTPDDLSYFNNDTLFVNQTDYASNGTGGVIKTGINSYDINSSGYLYADTQTYADYGNLANTNFIGKGTLENVITGKGLIDNTVNNLTNYTLSSNLSTVATSGDYDDLTNKPSIPTVNDGTLTIQVNGTTVNSFTANSSSNITTNITVPTHTSNLINDSNYLTSSDLPTPTQINVNTLTFNNTYINNHGYNLLYKYDKLCIFCFNVNLNNNIPNNTALVTGLPSTISNNRFVFIGGYGNGTIQRFYLDQDKLYNDGAISTGGWLNAQIIYICN